MVCLGLCNSSVIAAFRAKSNVERENCTGRIIYLINTAWLYELAFSATCTWVCDLAFL